MGMISRHISFICQKDISPSAIWAPRLTASWTAAKSFIRNILSLAISLKITEFFRKLDAE